MVRISRALAPLVIVVLLGSLVMVPVPAQNPTPPEQPEVTVDPTAGYYYYATGPVRAKRARTQTSGYTFGETLGWVTLPGSTITYTVPTGTADYFNVAFSAECRLVNGGAPDNWIRIRIVDNYGGVLTPLEPYDGQQAFCSDNNYATHKGNWVRRAGAGTHSLTVQFWIWDGGINNLLSGVIDDWTFEVVVYD